MIDLIINSKARGSHWEEVSLKLSYLVQPSNGKAVNCKLLGGGIAARGQLSQNGVDMRVAN